MTEVWLQWPLIWIRVEHNGFLIWIRVASKWIRVATYVDHNDSNDWNKKGSPSVCDHVETVHGGLLCLHEAGVVVVWCVEANDVTAVHR